jgi:oligopeptide transport system substrate-binding protein
MAGQGQVLLISGEPGIGKSRLVNELVTQARVSGGQAFSGASYAEGGSPYAPFRQILGQGLRDSPSGDGIELSEDVLADLLTLAPEFRSHYPELPERTPGDPLEEQQRLLESVGLYFNMLSNRAPLLLVLEDSHWADSGTISLMRHLARSCTRQPLMIALTYREVEIDEARTLHQALLDLQRERLAIRMKLSRLDREGTQALMATLFDEEITPDFLEGFYRESEGNPFFIEEIAKALVESGQLTFKDGRWHRPAIEELGIPQSIRVAVQARVSALSESSRIVLEQAAVLGRVFDLSTLELATELVEDSLIEALEEALAAQLIKEEPGEVPGAGELFSFVHALIPSSLVAGMRALRRRRLQRRAATALEEVHPDDYEVLAHHFIEAGQIDKGTGYLLQAGDQARAQYAHEEAIDSYRGAIDYLKEEGQLEQAAQTMMKLGLAYNNAFEFTQSRQAYEEGFALWQQASLSPAVESSRPSPHPLRLRIGEPDLLDPGFTNNWANGVFLDQLFSGLLQLTVEMDIIPDVAHSWQTLEGGRRYRFHLRDDVFWSDGIPVTAGDFAFAWKRMLSPGSGSVNASSLFTIKNGRDYHEGRLVSWDEVGVEIVDDLTLELTLENPDSTFLYLLCNMFAFAVPQHRLQEPDTHWMAWDEMVTNGPFRLAEWEPGQRLLLTANPGYHGRRSGNLESVEIIVPGSEGDEGRLALYEGDRLDVVLPAMAHAVQARNRFAGDHVSTPWLSSSYIGFNTTRAPFDDPRVRRALALATDRERLSDIFWQGGSFPASGGLVPPGMPGHVAGIAPPFDPEAAHRLLAEAGYGEKSTFPPQRFVTGPRYTMKKAYEYLAGQWYELLHIEIEVASLPRETYFERLLQGDPPAIFDGAWIADYPDPDNFLRLGSFRNYTGWRHEAYERLLHQARGMMDQEGRMVLYRQAQEILVEEAPIIPLFYARLTLLIKPWVRRFPTSPLKWSHWKDVVIEPH